MALGICDAERSAEARTRLLRERDTGAAMLMVTSIAAVRAGDAGASVACYVDQDGRDRHDHYAGHGEAPGVWHGAFADRLGLSGHAATRRFGCGLSGSPDTGSRPSMAATSSTSRRIPSWRSDAQSTSSRLVARSIRTDAGAGHRVTGRVEVLKDDKPVTTVRT